MAIDHVCPACEGSGLQQDDENWKYPCTVCDGIGVIPPGECLEREEPFDIDPNRRTLE